MKSFKITGKEKQKLEDNEDIKVVLMPKNQIDKMIRNGEITDLSFIAGMYLYELLENKS